MVRQRLAVLYPRKEAIRASVRALRSGRLVLIIGEHVSQSRASVTAEFLGRKQMTYSTAAAMAWRTRCPVAVLLCHRLREPFRFEGRLWDWIEPDPTQDRRAWIRTTTTRILRKIDTAVREHPEQYAWLRQHLLTGRDPG
jgi:lauroyl/myristoyl acyltransferase